MNNSIVYTVNDTIKLLEDFFDISRNEQNRYRYDEIVNKFKKDTIVNIIENFQLIVGVDKKFSITENLQIKHVKGIKQKQLALIFLKCLDKKFIDKSKKIDIQIITYNHQYFELEEYLAGVTFLVDHTKKASSKSIEIESLDNLITINPKNIAKNVRKSLTSTLTGKKDDHYFRVHPNSNNKIVSFKELGEYAHLKDKHKNIVCQICNKVININSKNLKDKILIKNKNIVKIVCHHLDTDYASELLFKFEIDEDKEIVGETHEEKAMFVLNNYTKLVDINKQKNQSRE